MAFRSILTLLFVLAVGHKVVVVVASHVGPYHGQLAFHPFQNHPDEPAIFEDKNVSQRFLYFCFYLGSCSLSHMYKFLSLPVTST